MAPKYQIGQKVVVMPTREQGVSLRDSSIEPYIGRTGEVTDYYWISPSASESFYLYTVRIDSAGRKAVVLHEDEIEA
ncbi:MAG: hypothetical protein JSV77_09735 [Dehalococcoidales bacterium]|nr:MAG: hypothetical protein JSV77_09735 [Dehalococcoidales bacterium]